MSDTVLMLGSETIGHGDDGLGRLLMRNFLRVLSEAGPEPRKIILVNSGVKLAAQGSEVAEELTALSKKGVEVVSCRTCLQFFNLTGQLAAGEQTNMHAIAQELMGTARVVII